MDFERYLTEIARQNDGVLAVARGTDPTATVPTCPEWTLTQLVGHLGGVQRWAAEFATLPTDAKGPKMTHGPDEHGALLDWFATGGTVLVDQLRTLGPDHPCKVFRGVQPATTWFWARRQAHEAVIHRLDAEYTASGDTGSLTDPEFAADGVDELLTTMAPMLSKQREPVAAQGKVTFHATDTGDTWTGTVTAETMTVTRTADGPGDATVTGTADELYRAVWGRPSAATVQGDRALLGAFAAP